MTAFRKLKVKPKPVLGWNHPEVGVRGRVFYFAVVTSTHGSGTKRAGLGAAAFTWRFQPMPLSPKGLHMRPIMLCDGSVVLETATNGIYIRGLISSPRYPPLCN